jgi:hypothetical protein
MDIVSLLGLISSVTGIVSFILYFTDKNNSTTPKVRNSIGAKSLQNWKFWLIISFLFIFTFSLASSRQFSGIQGNNNDANQIIIFPER